MKPRQTSPRVQIKGTLAHKLMPDSPEMKNQHYLFDHVEAVETVGDRSPHGFSGITYAVQAAKLLNQRLPGNSCYYRPAQISLTDPSRHLGPFQRDSFH